MKSAVAPSLQSNYFVQRSLDSRIDLLLTVRSRAYITENGIVGYRAARIGIRGRLTRWCQILDLGRPYPGPSCFPDFSNFRFSVSDVYCVQIAMQCLEGAWKLQWVAPSLSAFCFLLPAFSCPCKPLPLPARYKVQMTWQSASQKASQRSEASALIGQLRALIIALWLASRTRYVFSLCPRT